MIAAQLILTLLEVMSPAAPPGLDAWSELLALHTEAIELKDGELKGPGADSLLRSARSARMVAIGEEHLIAEVPSIVAAFFDDLHATAGFRHLATENGPAAMRALGVEGRRADRHATELWIRAHPMSLAFCSPEEVDLLLTVGDRCAGDPEPLWGFDVPTGAWHVLEEVRSAVPSEIEAEAKALLESCRERERLRFAPGDPRQAMMKASWLARPEATAELEKLHRLLPPTEGKALKPLLLSAELYACFARARSGEPWALHENGARREEWMKVCFLRAYRRSEAKTGQPPRVVLKGGAWHLGRGLNAVRVSSLGSFASALALREGGRSFHIGMISPRAPGAGPFTAALESGEWVYIDLVPLRGRPAAAELDPMAARWIDEYDALILIGNAQRGQAVLR
ncbi:MAG: hypothetical protein RL885_21200 [Planctomycetota bacterium]